MAIHFHHLKKSAEKHAADIRKKGYTVTVLPNKLGYYKWTVYSYRK